MTTPPPPTLQHLSQHFPNYTKVVSSCVCDFIVARKHRGTSGSLRLPLSLGHTETRRHAHTPFDVWSQSDFIGQCCDSLRILASLLSAHPDDKLLYVSTGFCGAITASLAFLTLRHPFQYTSKCEACSSSERRRRLPRNGDEQAAQDQVSNHIFKNN